MINIQSINYLRTQRLRTGFNQVELGFLLGEKDGSQVAHHERSSHLPLLRKLIGYEYIFDTDLQQLFPGDAKAEITGIVKRAKVLRKKIAVGKERPPAIARKLTTLDRLTRTPDGIDASLGYDQDYGCGSKLVAASLVKGGSPMWGGRSRVLAIDPISRGFGYAVFEQDPNQLLQWGVAQCRDYLRIDCLDRIGKLIKYFGVTDILVEDSCPIPRSRCHKLRYFIRKIKAVARTENFTVHVLPSSTIRATFVARGARNHEERARIVAQSFPELAHRVPPKRETWMTEDYWTPVFDALALIVTYLKTRKVKSS